MQSSAGLYAVWPESMVIAYKVKILIQLQLDFVSYCCYHKFSLVLFFCTLRTYIAFQAASTVEQRREIDILCLIPSPVKVTLIGAVLFTLQRRQYLPIARHNLVFLYTIFLVVFKVRI